MTLWIDAIGYAAGAITALCFVPQVLHTLKAKSAADVSFWMLVLTLLSVTLYEVYASLLGLWPVVVMNGVFLVLVAIELFLKILFTPSRSLAATSKDLPSPMSRDEDGNDITR